jgi:hypothetical protein
MVELPPGASFLAFVASLVLASTACTTDSESARDTAAPTTTKASSPFAWMEDECRDVGAAIAEDVLCPTWLPIHLAPTDNAFEPTRDGYMFEADGAEHWVFGANRDLRWERRYASLIASGPWPFGGGKGTCWRHPTPPVSSRCTCCSRGMKAPATS